MQIPKNWTFENTSVAQNFDKHVREQLPFYDLATNAISHIARHYIQENKLVYDIGASTGNIGNSDKTKEFIELYFGNNAINTTELKQIMPIYQIK